MENLSFKDLQGMTVDSLCNKYIMPPFSIFDARQGYWMKRKKEWISLGLQGELGRQDEESSKAIKSQEKLNAFQNKKEKGYKFAESQNIGLSEKDKKALGCYAAIGGSVIDRAEGRVGTSIFDPILCEIIYSWFCPKNGHILDPFAGGSTRGIVAEYLDFKYTGVDIRKEQIEANEIQAKKIGVNPTWIHGDSYELDVILPKNKKYDLLFTCPPYYDLEIYSEKQKDGSAFETYEKFMDWYYGIFYQAEMRLKDNRFFIVVVGEIRDKDGIYRNFVGNSISCFLDLGLKYYNEAILITSAGSLPIRIGKQFGVGRKLGKTHQNVLIFFKGDSTTIKDIFELPKKRKTIGKTNGLGF